MKAVVRETPRFDEEAYTVTDEETVGSVPDEESEVVSPKLVHQSSILLTTKKESLTALLAAVPL